VRSMSRRVTCGGGTASDTEESDRKQGGRKAQWWGESVGGAN
jgi:hypothetical protein